MFDISRNGIITMSRGDTWETEIFVNLGTELLPWGYDLQEGEYLYFGVMEPNQPFEIALIRKRIDMNDKGDGQGYYKIRFESKDTIALLPGNYYYEVKLQHFKKDASTGEILGTDVDTIIPRTKFVIYE